MNAREAEALLAGAVARRGGVWADFGAGDGAFTRALASLLGKGSRIYAVDRDADALASLEGSARANGVQMIPVVHDFTRPLELPGIPTTGLDGMLFANSLHFVAKPHDALSRLVTWLRPGGRVVIVEYDGRSANRWVPYPIDAARLQEIAAIAGLSKPRITATRPSAYGGIIYVARLTYAAAETAQQ